MLKRMQKKVQKAWDSTDRDLVVNKRELLLEFAVCALSGVLLGMLLSPRKTVTMFSHNTGAVHNHTAEQPEEPEEPEQEA